MFDLIQSYISSQDFLIDESCEIIPMGDTIHITFFYILPNIYVDIMKKDIEEILEKNGFFQKIAITTSILSHKPQIGKKNFQNIKNIIVVASGKGGVGKSTVSANLAISLANAGAQVGLLDADIYGPSQPSIMGSYENPYSDNGKIEPLKLHGIEVISIGNLVDKDSALIWRGPMITGALMQLFEKTNWRSLDYLIVDLPPGTGDVQLTLSKQIPIAGSIIVTTPQDLAKTDAQRAIAMFEKLSVPIIGIIENMSMYKCSNCGHEEKIFTSSSSHYPYQEKYNYIGEVPLSIDVSTSTNEGIPIVVRDKNGTIAEIYQKIALSFSQVLSCRPKCLDVKLPDVIVEKKRDN